MLTEDEARKVGIMACTEKIGYEFCREHADTAVCAYGVVDGAMQCYLGIDDKPAPDYKNINSKDLCLSSVNYSPYYAICKVDMEDASVTFVDYCLPESDIRED